MSQLAKIPTFAVVGQPNEGKTTVLATLAEDDRAEISPRPGTTTRARRYAVAMDGEEVLVLWDTPGFENSREVLRWFQHHQGDLPALFLKEFSSGSFQQECEILRPIAEGAAILYVVDASRPVRDVDRREVEILALCGRPRIALINSKEDNPEFLKDWEQLLAADFSLYCEFNAHRATFTDRLRLLQTLARQIGPWQSALGWTVQALQGEWESRLRQVSELMVQSLEKILSAEETAVIGGPDQRKQAEARARRKLEETLRGIEQQFRKDIRGVFRHSDEHWELHDMPVLADDLFSGEVWQLLGLAKWQLVLAAAGIGAASGVAVDVMTVGHSLGLGAAIGAAAGAGVAWAVSGQAIRVRLPGFKLGRFRVGEWKLGGETAVAKVDPRSNLVWILIDRFLLYAQLATSWAHGRRQGSPLQVTEAPEKRGATAGWREQRKAVVAYISSRQQKRPDPEVLEESERNLRQVLLTELRNMTMPSTGL